VRGFHQPAVLLRVVVEGLVGRHVDAREIMQAPRVEAVDNVEQLGARYLHHFVTVTPSSGYVDLNAARA
jgi:hypothetical protein